MRNGDPNFDELLLKSGMISSDTMQSDKKFLYYFVCIIVRFILYSLVLFLHDNKYIPYIILLASIFAVLNLSYSLYQGKNSQWWSKKFQVIVGILLIITSILLIFQVISNTYIIPAILFISLFGGIFQSIMNP